MLLNDFRYSARALIKNPAFSLLAIMTIAIGIGANTSIFTAVNGVLLKTFSFPEAEHLVVVNGVSNGRGIGAERAALLAFISGRNWPAILDRGCQSSALSL
jgi:hypothetical protein